MSNNTSSGIGIIGVLQIIFIVLKLTGLISWSWPVVLIPLWIDLGILLLGFFIAIGVGIHHYRRRKR